jgi:hypothetical protein
MNILGLQVQKNAEVHMQYWNANLHRGTPRSGQQLSWIEITAGDVSCSQYGNLWWWLEYVGCRIVLVWHDLVWQQLFGQTCPPHMLLPMLGRFLFFVILQRNMLMSMVCFRTEEKQQLVSATIYIWSKVYQCTPFFLEKILTMYLWKLSGNCLSSEFWKTHHQFQAFHWVILLDKTLPR